MTPYRDRPKTPADHVSFSVHYILVRDSIRQHDHKTNLLALTPENVHTMAFIYTLCTKIVHFFGRPMCGFRFYTACTRILKPTICIANFSPPDKVAL